ncbi:amino acid adenylation domain-containing protein [Streptomyces sp. QH1-20]|uniref:hybrid non-ribosomal peptide synthetase/type I polyketide synthase n=1 Tax=Streptomyces sp. QH1-20 TaxID=3240934 RepID=UPI0035175191
MTTITEPGDLTGPNAARPEGRETDRNAVLVQSIQEIRRLRAEVAAEKRARTEPIAIVGMACRMPGGADGPEAFWEFLRNGGDGIREIPDSRWDTGRFHDPDPRAPGRTYTRRAGLLSDVDRFDASFFGIAPREAATLDPQQRLLLETGWEALEHAGRRPDGLAGSATGVFLGITNNDYGQQQLYQIAPERLEAHALTSNASTFAAGRLSYWLGLNGPSMSVDTACSSSLVAVHLAVQSLRSGESSTALAGGVNVLLSPEWFVVLSKARMLAPDGRCKTFDAAADGYVRSEGCGMVVLKRLSDAEADGDRVWAVIRGSAVNQDGRSSGVTVPNASAQKDVIRRAMAVAAVPARRIGYVEAHGTGTPLGDPIELRALRSALGEHEGTEPLLVGSVKTNVGHLEPAAGIAGLIKIVMSLHHKEIPPHLHLREVNPEIPLDELRLRVPTALTPWPAPDDGPRAGSISSFGASGTNAHIVLEEAPDPAPAPADPDGGPGDRTTHVLALSAKSPAALTALAERYHDHLGALEETAAGGAADLCFTANTARAHFPHRLAVTGATAAELRERLTDRARGEVRRGYVPAGSRTRPVFLFTGQGAQYPGMAREADTTEPVFRAALDRCDEVLRPLLGRPLREVLHPRPEDARLVHETRFTQPALFAVEFALAELWRSWGVTPAAVLGHSVGELVAATVAGVLSPEDGLRLAAHRGRLMQDLGGEGAMAAVLAGEERVREALAPYAAEVSLAAVNGPDSVVVSGASAAVGRLREALAEQGVRTKDIRVTRAFHSPLMDPVLDAFEAEAARIAYGPARIPLISNLTGEALLGEGVYDAAYLRAHIRRPVDFHAGMRTLYGQGHRVFLEAGPSPTLLGMADCFAPEATEGYRGTEGTEGPEGGGCLFLPSLRPRHDDGRVLADSLAALYTAGAAVDWDAYDSGRGRRRTTAPLYPFQRTRHWSAPSAPAVAPAPASATAGRSVDEAKSEAVRPLLGRRVPSPLEVVQYESRLSPLTHRCLGDCVVDGLPVVNIGVYLEAVFAAVHDLGRPGPVTVRDLLVLQSLVIDQGETRNAQLLVEPAADGRHSFGYYAEHQGDDGPHWLQHARGTAAPGPEAPPGAVDTAAVRARLGGVTTGEEFYHRMWQRRVYLGTSAQWVEEVRHAPGEALARMRAPRPEESASYLLHPGLTDAMFQTLFACPPDGTPRDAVFMLVGVDRFVLHDYDRTRPLLCHATVLPSADPASTIAATVRLLTEDGHPVAEAEGVYLKRAERARLLPAAQGRPDGSPARKAPTPPPAARTPAPRPAAGPAEPVRDVLTRIVARALGADPAELDLHEPLPGLGLDSLMALEVKDALARELGISLPLVAFLEGRSITQLGDEARALRGEEGPEPGPDPAGAVDADAGARPTAAVGAGTGSALPALLRDEAGRYEPFGLTDLQQAYLVGRTSAFELGAVSTYFFLEVDVEADVDRLAAALRTLITRHDMLRAVVSPDGYQRVLDRVPDYELRTLDLREHTDSAREERLAAVHEEMRNQVFDTSVWPLFDIRATRLDERRTRLHIGLDALIIDAWSTSLLLEEWATVYREGADALAELSLTYRDYVRTARTIEGTPAHAAAEAYWEERLPTLPPAPELPLAKNPATVEHPRFTHRSIRLDAAAWAAFKRRASAAGVTPSAALCTAYSQVLGAWSKSGRFTLNVLFFNRLPLHPDVGKVVGNFSATTLLEVDAAASEGFAVRAERVQKQLWTDLEHSQVSGVDVLRRLNRRRGTAAMATMPVVFASMVNFAAGQDSAASSGVAQHLVGLGESGREVSSSIRTPQVWLDHQVVEDAGELVVNWDVIEEIFPAGMIDAMFTAYIATLRELCADDEAWRRPAAALAPAADLDVRAGVNATAGPVPEGLLHEPFVARAALTPDAPAVLTAERTITYGELDRHANRLDHALRAKGVRPGDLVGIVMDKGWEQLAAAIGILKSGAAYVPIDAAVPAERLRRLLDIAGISVVLTQPWVEVATNWPADTVRLPVDEAFGAGAAPVEEDTALPAPDVSPGDLAYVIFTSGSTGLPKGVMIEHGAALNTVRDVNDTYGITEHDRVLALSALNFDLSVYDVFGLLAAGGAVVLPDPGAHREPARWAELMVAHDVTVWNSVPTLMEMFTEHALAEGLGELLSLRVVMMSGDWIPVTLPDRIRALAPDAEIWSLGGATEASIWSIRYRVGDVDPSWTAIPYGKPMRNQRFHVLDDALRPCPVWVPGQLYIAGTGLARGYLGDEEKARASFPRHPVTGERLYRTGDLGRWLPDGNIEFLGREDFQVKINGYRVELGEVEAALLRRPEVRAAAAAATGERHEAKRLVAYVVLDGEPGGAGTAPDEPAITGALDRALRAELPDYLVPHRIVVLDRLPLSANGKVDRAALPAPDTHPRGTEGIVPPRDAMERELADIWGEFFDERPVGVTASFFDLGGNSLLAVRLMGRIQSRTGRSLPLSTLFARPTIELLAQTLRDAGDGSADRRTALVPIRPEGTAVPLIFVHPVGGDVLCYSELASLLGEDQPFYGLQVPDLDEPPATVPAMAAHYAQAITERFPDGPYRLGGWSMGGVLALEISALLTEAGRNVELIALVDLLEPPGQAAPGGRAPEDVDDAALLAWFARDLAGLAGHRWDPDPGLFRTADGTASVEALHDHACRAGVLPGDITPETLKRIVERFSRNSRALMRHQPRNHPDFAGRTLLCRAKDGGATRETTAAWAALLPGDHRITEVPGDHYTAMARPHLAALAGELRTALAAGQGEGVVAGADTGP